MQPALDQNSVTSAEAPGASAVSASALDSGVDVGSSNEFDQENDGSHVLQAQDDTSEASTDEG